MKSTILRSVGEALYGLRWQTNMARDLNVSDRTIRRWAADENEIPAGIARDLERICKTKIVDLEKTIDHLKAVGKAF